MRIAFVMNMAPRKLGSTEELVAAFCREAAWQGHRVDAYGRSPVHPTFAKRLQAFGVRWRPLELLERGASSVRLLSSYDVIHMSMCAPRSKVALAAYAALPAKVLFVAHTDHLRDSSESKLRALARRALDRVTLSRVHMLAGVSDYVRRREGDRFGLPEHRRRTIYNGVDTQRFRPPAQETPGLRLFSAGYFQPHKGFHHLLNAFARVREPRATLTIAGDGPELERLRTQAVTLGVADRVTFVGLRDDLEQWLPNSDVFVHCSYVEAFGMCIAEAMACGRTVVATRVGGVPELIEDGQSGLLVPPGDEAALASAIERLLVDPDLRQRLGVNARARAVQRFSVRRAAMDHVSWCEEAFAERLWLRRTLRSEEPVREVLEIPQRPASAPARVQVRGPLRSSVAPALEADTTEASNERLSAE